MDLRIAIQPDAVVHPNGVRQSFSERWRELARERGIGTAMVDVFSDDIVAQIATCDAFMWRCPSSAHPRTYARRLCHAVEKGLGIPVFPALDDSWYFEDKIAQDYFFEAAGIPMPATRVCWTRASAMQFCDAADYPFVLKLAGGHQSSNVRLVHNRKEAHFYIDQLFGHGVVSLGYLPAGHARRLLRRLRATAAFARGLNPYGPSAEAELQYGYFYAQEFLPDNDFEISAIVIGNRAFACRRFVHPGDFRTRGSSGRIDWTPEAIGEDAIRLAYRIVHELGARTIAVDMLRRGTEPVAIELTVNYADWVVRACPGHWVLEGSPESGSLTWVDGCVDAADAVFDDFVAAISRSRHASGSRIATVAPPDTGSESP